MLRFLRLASTLRFLKQQNDLGGDGKPAPVVSDESARRTRLKQRPAVESVESRFLLSTADLSTRVSDGRAEVLRIAQSPCLLTAVSGTGVHHGLVTLTATLTSAGTPLAGKTIRFKVRDRAVGKATTNDQGIATLSSDRARGLNVGKFSRGVVAAFSGDSGGRPVTARGGLTVSRFGSHLILVSSGGPFGSSGTLAAILTFNGASLPGMPIQFQLRGQTIGTARTSASGIATLPNVSLAGLNAGVYANQVTATFAGSTAYSPNAVNGSLSVTKAQVSFNLSGLNQTYDGTAKFINFTASTPGLAPQIVYTDASGQPVAAPTRAGTYPFVLSADDANFTGTTTGTLTIGQRLISITGITASSKVYDGTSDATLNTGSAALVGVIPGDNVSLNVGSAVGTFDSKDVGVAKAVTVTGLSFSGPDAGNYTALAPMPTADITAATLTVTGITAANKVHDGTTTATLNFAGATLVGIIPGDQVSLDTTNAIGTFDNPNVGTNKTVSITGLALFGLDSGNYILTQPTTTASIT
jgi:trimeric autotransporter adhesin